MKQYFLLILLTVMPFGICWGQSEIDSNAREQVKQYAMQRVNEFNGDLSFISSKKYENSVKDFYIREALRLFIGRGEASRDLDGNMIPAPVMEVSSINRRTHAKRVRSRLLKTYLNALKDLRYDEVKVTSSSAVFMSTLQKVGTGRYEAVLTYAQVFVAKNDGITVYRDVTKKSIRVHIRVVENGEQKRYDVLLGDVKVNATE